MENAPVLRKTLTLALAAFGLLGGMLTPSCDNPLKEVTQAAAQERDALQLSQDELFILACLGRDEKVVRRMLEAGQNPNVVVVLPFKELTPLTAAIQGTESMFEGDYKNIVRLLLDHGADPGFPDNPSGKSALARANQREDEELIDLLLAHGAPVNQLVSGGRDIVFVSSEGGTRRLQKYLDHGADVNLRTVTGETPLHLAVRFHREGIEMLCQHGADVNALDNEGRTPLMLYYNYIPVGERNGTGGGTPDKRVDTLLSYGADPQAGSYLGYNTQEAAYLCEGVELAGFQPSAHLRAFRALYDMCGQADFDEAEAERLLADVADINAWHYTGETLLTYAIMSSNLRMVKLLLAHGADPNRPDSKGIHPLYSTLYAFDKDCRFPIKQALVHAGARIQDLAEGEWADCISSAELLHFFLDDKEVRRQIPFRDLGDLCLMAAVYWNEGFSGEELWGGDSFPDCHPLDFFFTDCGRDINDRDAQGRTILMACGTERLVPDLIARGADVNAADNEGRTALMYATHSASATEALLAAGADPNAQDKQGNTAMHYIAMGIMDPLVYYASTSTLESLRRHGADPTIRNKAGQTPADLCRPLLGPLFIDRVDGKNIRFDKDVADAAATARRIMELLTP